MSVDSTLLLQEIDAVVAEPNTFRSSRIEVNLLANKQWVTPIKVDYYNLHRDYGSGQLGDIINIEVSLLYGDFALDILPYRDDIIVELIIIPILEGTDAEDMVSRRSVRRYKGVINLDGMDDPSMTNKHSQMTSKDSMNQVGLIPVQIQLVDEIVYKLMMVSVGETLRQTTTMEGLLALYSRYSQLLGGSEDTRLKSINYVEGFNTELRHQIPIPDGTLLKDLHTFLQVKEGGIYPTGLGRYIQNQEIYVYPLYDTTQYAKDVKVLNLINVPNERYQGAENTFKDTTRCITVLATGDATALDVSLAEQIQTGNGFRFGNANKILTDFGISKDNRLLVDKATNLFEVVVDKLKDGLNNTRWTADRFTSNPYKHYSELSRRKGIELSLDWTNGCPDLLYPGMPVKFQTIVNDLVKTYYGVLLGVKSTRVPSNIGVPVQRHMTMVQLGVFVNRVESDE